MSGDSQSVAPEHPGGDPPVGDERGRGGSSSAAAPARRVDRRALAPLKHGGQATVAIAPQVKGVRRELCRRLGVRYADLTAAGRESVDLYARSRAKLAAIDNWLMANPMLDESGQPAACLALYSTLLNTSARLLAQVLAVIEAMDRADGRYDKLRRHIELNYPAEGES